MLGAVDSSFVLDAIAALAAGDGQRVVTIADRLREAGVSAAFALEDMARVLQKMAVYQAIGKTAAADAASGDAEEAAIAQLAQAMPADETQLLYSLAIHGRAELGLAPDEYAGLVMTLLRLLAFKPAGFKPPAPTPAPTPSSAEKKSLEPALIAEEKTTPAPQITTKTEAAQAGFSAKTAENTQKNTANAPTAASPAPNAEPRTAEAAQAAPAEPVPPVPPPALSLPVREMSEPPAAPASAGAKDAAAHADWLDLVQRLEAKGQLQALVRELALQSECRAAGEGWRTLVVEQNALRAEAVREKLQTLLQAELGQACLLRVELGEVGESLGKRQLAAKTARQQEAERHFASLPLVQHLLQDWGGKIVAGSVQPST